MKRFSFLYLFFFLPIHVCFAQTTDKWENKAKSLSKIADFYFTAHNYDKAIDYESQSLAILDSLYGNNSLQYASSALNVAKYYFTRGTETSDKKQIFHSSDFRNATLYLNSALENIKEMLLEVILDMDYQSKYNFWKSINGLFDSIFPSYVAKNQNDSTISALFDNILFSKEILWKNEPMQKYKWEDIQSELQEDEIAIEFISPVTPQNDNVIFYALTLKRGYNAPHMVELFNIWQLQDSLKKKCINERERYENRRVNVENSN